MPTPPLPPSRPQLLVDGLAVPALDDALLRLVQTERHGGSSSCEIELANWGRTADGSPGYLWSDGGLLRPGTALAVQLGATTRFAGRVQSLQLRCLPMVLPSLVLRCGGGRTATPPPASAAPALRWGAELLQLESRIDKTGTRQPQTGLAGAAAQARGVLAGSACMGPAAPRAGSAVDLLGIGPLFEGRYTVQTLTLRFDLAEGLRAEFTATRQAAA